MHLSDQRRPAGLMARAAGRARVAVEVLVEQHQVPPVRVVGEARVVAVAGPAAVRVGQEEPRQPRGELVARPRSRFIMRPEPVGHST